ncbi:glycoside hydrolase family 3 N-terminal domain-containing protein [Myroides sp. JBRI-B21084]|uniref:glycoside hydrolase family 3 N-terminal domain-containing protein n=1 Tax=Myroides sp. JBRI-B21084 TaxID=3119977 RepID=UPI0026E4125E|nr:glycoside hydrolase family 3 N-terminal domain-containing protein [Paenimyroides cloacae]WKW46823.1 glycoside hydrolase family 3 N-terminal domain-containing protein [Paenimyroides cloacae]
MKKIWVLFILTPLLFFAQSHQKYQSAEKWVDSVYNQMSFNEKVGQLFMVAAYSNRDSKHLQDLLDLVKTKNIGGVIFFQGGPGRQASMTNKLNAVSKVPLFVGIDAEWGLGMRLDSTHVYPWNLNLGAIQNNNLIKQMGQQMGEQAKRLGVHFMFAPVVDINTNPLNPIISNRSFGESKDNVANKATALMQGLQSENVFATAKHFPGHGDTATDSHHSLPKIDFDKKRLDYIELYPYKKLIKDGLASVMVAHLSVPALESQPGVPTSLSYNTITNVLKNDLNFKGLIFTDALNMKGVANHKSPGEVDLAAFLAGNDVLLFAENVPLAVDKFNEAFKNGLFTEERLAHSVKKILLYKFKAGLNKYQSINTQNIYADLNKPEYTSLTYKLFENMVTVVKNDQKIVPLNPTKPQNIAYVKLGDDTNDTFIDALQANQPITIFNQYQIEEHLTDLNAFDLVIVGYHKADGVWKKHDMNATEINLLDKISKSNKTIFVSFVKPYALSEIKSFANMQAVVLGYQNNIIAHRKVADVLFGMQAANGKLSVSVGKHFNEGDGIDTKPNKNLRYSRAIEQGFNETKLKEIDVLVNKAIKNGYMPGAQVLVARNGNIVYNKSFGNLTYNEKDAVTNQTIYDLASLSKMLGTLPMVMKMYNDGKLRFDQKLGNLLPEFKRTDKANITVKEMLTHNSGLTAWIPFYKETLDANGKPLTDLYKPMQSAEFNLQVNDNLYLKSDYKKTILETIASSKLGKKEYKYSDLNFILLAEIVERTYKKPLNELVTQNFYNKINANNLTYLPLTKFDVSQIAPTEIDNYFRHTTVQGYVHDMGAAMMGGVAGHAGLFGNALDVAKMMQLFLDEGAFNGEQLVNTKTIKDFNTCYYCQHGNRRGAGFDKPQLGTSGPTCGCASMQSFGHTGFTGTMAWADPEKNLIYVFLSNRTYPNADDNKLSKSNTREDIQQIIYDALIQ